MSKEYERGYNDAKLDTKATNGYYFEGRWVKWVCETCVRQDRYVCEVEVMGELCDKHEKALRVIGGETERSYMSGIIGARAQKYGSA